MVEYRQKIEIHPLLLEWTRDPILKSEKRPRTIKTYAGNISKFLRWHDKSKKAFTSFKTEDIAIYLSSLQEKNLSNSYINNNYWSIRIFAEYLNEKESKELVFSNKELKKLHNYYPSIVKNEKPQTKALTIKEQHHVIQILQDSVLQMIFFTGITYGLRAEEYIKLEISDIDLQKRGLYIREGKGLNARRIPIRAEHVETWEKWFESRKIYKQTHHNSVFFSSRGILKTRTLQRLFNRMSELAYPLPDHLKGKDLSEDHKRELKEFRKKYWFTSHDLRRTFATNCERNEMKPTTIQAKLGHSNLATTSIYLRFEESEQDEDFLLKMES